MTRLNRPLRSRLGGLLTVLAAVVLFALAPRDTAPDSPGPEGEVAHPLSIRLDPQDTPTPGATLTTRVEVTAHRLVDDVEVTVRPSDGVRVLTGRSTRLGLLRAETPATTTFMILVPLDEVRRTVDVLVRGHVDGFPVTRGATLNLNFREESSRTVTRPDGRRVREVAARRVG